MTKNQWSETRDYYLAVLRFRGRLQGVRLSRTVMNRIKMIHELGDQNGKDKIY